jgi:putative ABC transport system permease protein
MSVFERAAEFGTMRALGNRDRFISGLVLLECTVLGVAGAVGGALLGALLATLISSIGVPMPPPPNSNTGYLARIELVPGVIASSLAIGAIATIISGILPGVRASRQSIVDALRSGA